MELSKMHFEVICIFSLYHFNLREFPIVFESVYYCLYKINCYLTSTMHLAVSMHLAAY